MIDKIDATHPDDHTLIQSTATPIAIRETRQKLNEVIDALNKVEAEFQESFESLTKIQAQDRDNTKKLEDRLFLAEKALTSIIGKFAAHSHNSNGIPVIPAL